MRHLYVMLIVLLTTWQETFSFIILISAPRHIYFVYILSVRRCWEILHTAQCTVHITYIYSSMVSMKSTVLWSRAFLDRLRAFLIPQSPTVDQIFIYVYITEALNALLNSVKCQNLERMGLALCNPFHNGML